MDALKLFFILTNAMWYCVIIIKFLQTFPYGFFGVYKFVYVFQAEGVWRYFCLVGITWLFLFLVILICTSFTVFFFSFYFYLVVFYFVFCKIKIIKFSNMCFQKLLKLYFIPLTKSCFIIVCQKGVDYEIKILNH